MAGPYRGNDVLIKEAELDASWCQLPDPHLARMLDLVKYVANTPNTLIVAPDGRDIPRVMLEFQVGEKVVIKGYTFNVAYTNEATLVLEPLGIHLFDVIKDREVDDG